MSNFSGLLQCARQLEVLARFARGGARDESAEERVQALAEVVADGQHHDAITGLELLCCGPLAISSSFEAGTSMQHVVYDLHKRLAASAAGTFADVVAPALSSLLSLHPPSPLQPCPLLNASICPPSSSSPSAFTLVIYNPLKHSQTMRVRVPVSMSRSLVKREGGGGVLAALMPCWWCEQQHQMLLHVIASVDAMSSVVITVMDAGGRHEDDFTEAAAATAEGGKTFPIETMSNGIVSIELSLNPSTALFLRNMDSNVRPLFHHPQERAHTQHEPQLTRPQPPQVTTALRFDWFHYNSTDAFSGAYLFRSKTQYPKPQNLIPKTPKLNTQNPKT